MLQVWIFGDLWCSMWLALDVWMCTASILNLCAISLDRYVAVTRPITYPSIMSHHRAKLLIAGLWVLSFVICFPPLVGWKDTQVINDFSNNITIIALYDHKQPLLTSSTDDSLTTHIPNAPLLEHLLILLTFNTPIPQALSITPSKFIHLPKFSSVPFVNKIKSF